MGEKPTDLKTSSSFNGFAAGREKEKGGKGINKRQQTRRKKEKERVRHPSRQPGENHA